ncbi:MAG: acyltransferase family protein [Lachnospiraceae bacterium]|nr:acyltransferase family protein [Lachnospiraceae bacterium]
MSERKRLDYVDAAKGLSIIMIMMGHITSYYNPLDQWMSSFKVSVFYVISGFLMCYTGSVKNRTFKEFIKKLFMNICVPYIWFCVLGLLFKIVINLLRHKSIAAVISVVRVYAIHSVCLKGINSMWFIPTLIIGEIVFYILLRTNWFVWILYGIIGPFSITIFSVLYNKFEAIPDKHSVKYLGGTDLMSALGKGFMAAWFIGAGYLIYVIYKKLENKYIKLILGIIFSVSNYFISYINPHVDINLLKEGDRPYLFYVTGIVGSIGAIMILDFISSFVKLTFLDYWGKNSLIVMCTHTVLAYKAIAYEGWRWMAHFKEANSAEYILHCFIVLALLMLMQYTVIHIINNYLPFLIGRKKPKKAVATPVA